VQSSSAVRSRRDASKWTNIHPIFAIGQLGVFLVSVVLFGLYFLHIVPFAAVHLSVLIKIVFMIGAIITGSLWEKDVFGKWWFAHEFFIEDVMTADVFALHIGYLITFYCWPQNLNASLALLGVAYLAYAANVAQYIASHMNMRNPKELAGPGMAA
jgi:3-vinyl bacteriochlorophyllide hydratase